MRAKNLILTLLLALICPCFAAAQTAGDSLIVLTGTVKDQRNKKVITNAYVTVRGTNIGTVTNADGVFSLKLTAAKNHTIDVSHIGYHSSSFSSANAAQSATIFLARSTKVLDEVVVTTGDARDIFVEAMRRVPENYSLTNDSLTAFYRETVQKGKRYTSIAEAMASIAKTSYKWQSIAGDRVKLLKGRRLMSQKASDTLAIKVQGGPTLALQFDFAKNGELPFSPSDIAFYKFKMLDPTFLDDRRQFVISIEPMIVDDVALFGGKAYIDAESLAFTRIELDLDMRDRDKVVSTILRKKPKGLHFKPLSVQFVISYRQTGGRYFLNYVKNEIRFKCDWKRRLFSSTYTSCTEMVVVDNAQDAHPAISRKESFSPSQVFYDVVQEYWDPDFWRDYNILEPTESLEKAVEKLKKR